MWGLHCKIFTLPKEPGKDGAALILGPAKRIPRHNVGAGR